MTMQDIDKPEETKRLLDSNEKSPPAAGVSSALKPSNSVKHIVPVDLSPKAIETNPKESNKRNKRRVSSDLNSGLLIGI